MKKLFLIISAVMLLAHPQLAGQSLLLNDQPGNTAAKLNVQTPASSLFVAGSSLPEVLDHVFDSLTSISVIKGFNAAMLLPDGTLWKRASGLAEQIPAQIDLTTDHLMGMGSISKSFVSATMLLLLEDGLLSLDDSIGQYLEPYTNVPGHTTIRQLLSHRSGINDYKKKCLKFF